ncbi:Dihydroorotate dehydrogenase, electron transfer subunit, iron-sulfur cluster binding domain protein [mine drainage metagenome]
MMCGPEGMMHAGIGNLIARGIAEERIYLSMERSMHCAVGHCGHCQYGPNFVCRDGPVFSYPQVRNLFRVRGL